MAFKAYWAPSRGHGEITFGAEFAMQRTPLGGLCSEPSEDLKTSETSEDIKKNI